jgi:hypothetical protein
MNEWFNSLSNEECRRLSRIHLGCYIGRGEKYWNPKTVALFYRRVNPITQQDLDDARLEGYERGLTKGVNIGMQYIRSTQLSNNDNM